MKCELTFRLGRTRPAHARSRGSDTLSRIRSLAGSTIDTLESSFQKRHVLQGYGEHSESARCYWPGVPAIRDIMATPTSVGGIKSRGVPHGIALIDRAVSEGRHWFVRSDIKNFFTHIPKQDVNKFIRAAVSDDRFAELFEHALATNLENQEELEERRVFKLFPDCETGVAQGSALSALAGNIALRGFDVQMNGRGIVCVRYIDDFILLGPTEAKTLAAYESARKYLRRMRMDVYDLSDIESRRAAKVDAGNIHNGTDVLGYRISGHSRQPSSAACRSLLDKLDDLIRRSRRKARAVMGRRSTSNDFRYYQSMVKLHNLVWGWSQAFRHSTAMHVFVQLDKEIDKRIEEIDLHVRRLVSADESVVRRRIMGIHVLADTPSHPLPDVNIDINADDSSSIRDQELAA